jgi:hypothetical protein
MGGSGLISLKRIKVTLSYHGLVDLLGKGGKLEKINSQKFFLGLD